MLDIVNLQKQNCPFLHHVLPMNVKMCSVIALFSQHCSVGQLCNNYDYSLTVIFHINLKCLFHALFGKKACILSY